MNAVIFQRKIIQIIRAHLRHATVCRHTCYDTILPVSQKSIFCQSFTYQLAQNRHYKGTVYALQKANKVSATLSPDSRMMKELFYGSTAEVFQEPVLLQSSKLPVFLLLNFSLLKKQWLTDSFLTGTNDGLLPPSEDEFLGHQFVFAQSIGLREYFSL